MQSEIPPHEKVRFRRDDLTCLDSLPSAQGTGSRRRPLGTVRVAFRAAAGLALSFVAIVAAIAVALHAGVGEERLRIEAEAALMRILGTEFVPTIGSVGLSIEGPGMLALEVAQARLVRGVEEREMLSAGRLRFGLAILPLLRGELRLGDIEVSGARVDVTELPRAETAVRFDIFNDQGLVDPDAAATALFDAARQLVAASDHRELGRIDLKDVQLALSSDERTSLDIESASIGRQGPNAIALDASLLFGEQRAALNGEAVVDRGTGLVSRFHVELESAGAVARSEGAAQEAAAGIDLLHLVLDGSQIADRNNLTVSLALRGLTVPVGRTMTSGDIVLRAATGMDAGKIEIERLNVAVGRSQWLLHGAFGPAPAVSDQEPGYRFELVSDGSTISPEGSPEAALAVVARIAGTLDRDGREIAVQEIGVRSTQGEVSGTARVSFAGGGAPGIDLRLGVSDLAVSNVKQLWPWFAAPTARGWVLRNIYGGRVESGWLQLTVPPARLGDGVPLTGDEVAGQFQVRGTRFDIAGRIPPVRDGVGSIDFRGTDVDIALESGTVFMPSGRTVAASDGTFAIRAAHVQPVIGKLDIGVEGAADAVLELASYDPINVERYLRMAPDELSGTVTGSVKADIPLRRTGGTVDGLDWQVALDYADLSLAQPLEGQQIAGATGSITVDPGKAVIKTSARLNGSPATIELVEPLGGSAVQRTRRITMTMDDKARHALAPGLDAMLAGDTKVELDQPSREQRTIRADLTQSRLTVPWVGWTKGGGVPGTVSFAMTGEGNRMTLGDFRLSGDTFGASGTVTLVDGQIETIRFASAKLSRNDDFSLDLRRRSGRYEITIRGKSIDARSLIKLYGPGKEAGEGEARAVPVTVDLQADTISGFHGEVLRNVSLQYSGTGARTDTITFSATTTSGRPVSLKDGRTGEARSVELGSTDAGALLRFLDVYERMQGGSIAMSLRSRADGPMVGQIDARDFNIVNEPRIATLVSTPPASDGRSLNQAVRGDLDTSSVYFERGYTEIARAPGSLALSNGVLRGPLIGATFQGTLYDPQGNINLTGTFMPAYGLNRIFGEIPIIGAILGNGRDRGLIGITFRLAGKAGEPQLNVNPLSVIAPGIFRSVFEYR